MLFEGKSTGGEDTAEKLGSWYASHDPKAKPGQEGYMRGRNVPPTDPEHPGSKYDPTKHKAPVKGKPLRYMKPKHRDYAANRVNTTLARVAAKITDKEEQELGTAGNIHKRDKDKRLERPLTLKKGKISLRNTESLTQRCQRCL